MKASSFQIIGPVVDVTRSNSTLEATRRDLLRSRLTSSEQQHLLGERTLRCVAMQGTDGMYLSGILKIRSGSMPIHRPSPAYVDLDTSRSILETGEGYLLGCNGAAQIQISLLSSWQRSVKSGPNTAHALLIPASLF